MSDHTLTGKKGMRLCQNSGTTFFMHKAQTFASPGFAIPQSFYIFVVI